jgi:ribosomal protein S18 acetylase RimI-like enzyme
MNPEQPTLRRATLSDVAAIVALTNAAYAKYIPRIGRKPQPMTTDYRQFVNEYFVWVLELEQQLAGVLVLQQEPHALLIYSVAVHPVHQIHPVHQKCGFGRLLLAWAEQEAQQAGYTAICLYTNARMEENIALYTQLGYQETQRETYLDNVRVYMRKQLLPGATT